MLDAQHGLVDYFINVAFVFSFQTGRVPKIHLLKPEFVIVITFELFLLGFKKLIGRGPTREKVKAE